MNQSNLPSHLTGNAIRKTFIDFFKQRGHTFVPSSSLVPGGDQTLLFTNAGMVQFKDVFLGTDQRPYTRAVNSQKCMRVAGKHNDLEDVGRDNSHHTFFEMLGNWSFGDYYKHEAITWAWELVTGVWGLPKDRLYAACFKDELDEIPTDTEAATGWASQPGFDPSHVFYFGRKDNFWEMAETGPCGPNSEIHIDLHPERGPLKADDITSGRCLELWNLVFIQYNRTGPNSLEPLPNKHVDTGMGFERIVSVLQGVYSNYRTDLLWPLIQVTQRLTGHDDMEREANLTPYRVIADHGRAAAFLIADGVVPGNIGRNYICRMIIRRAARFGSKIGLKEPFLSKIAETVIENYGDFYQELTRNRSMILENITREEERFQRTVESGITKLDVMLERLLAQGKSILPGDQAFELYATYGLPLEITRDIVREQGLDVDETGFILAMEEHRLASGAGEAFGPLGDEGVDVHRQVLVDLQSQGLIGPEGVSYDPYRNLETRGTVLALLKESKSLHQVETGDRVEVILPKTCFYIESGGQVSDTGTITSQGTPDWEIRIEDTQKPAAGVIVHVGQVVRGRPQVGDEVIARVNYQRRKDIMRNHTATHLLHAELHTVLGPHARQAGSLVAPDRLRFDFTHPEALTPTQLAQIEAGVNHSILMDYSLKIVYKPLQQAISEGAMALFGEKYADTVRTITIDTEPERLTDNPANSSDLKHPYSYELCGGTHVDETGDIGIFLITSESSVASGIRRIEAVTGRGAYELIRQRFQVVNETATLLETTPEQLFRKSQALLDEIDQLHKQSAHLRRELAIKEFQGRLDNPSFASGIPIITAILPDADNDTLRQMADRFRQQYLSGVAVLASVLNGQPILVAAVTEDLVQRGLHAGELVKFIARPLGGSGGGRPNLAQAGGKNPAKLEDALGKVTDWVESKI
jgi:alanyl-tRNA synthetase